MLGGVRWLVLLCLAGCVRDHYRYIDLPLPPDQATAEIEHEAARAGLAFVRSGEDCGAVHCDRANVSLWRDTRWTSYWLVPHGSGSRLEIQYSNEHALVLTPELAARAIHEVVPQPYEPEWADWLDLDFELSGGVERDPRAGFGWRTNFVGQLGPRLARWGQLGDDARISHSVSLLAGGGLAVASTGASALAELTLSFDRQALVEPMPGEHIPMGPRDALDFTIAGRFADDSRSGIEGAITLRRVGLGGITARAGYLWGPGGGATASLGVRILDPWRAYIAALGIGFVVGCVYGLMHPPSITVSGG